MRAPKCSIIGAPPLPEDRGPSKGPFLLLASLAMRVLLLLTALMLAGCGMTDRYTDRKCREYGAKPGTDAYVQCRATIQAGVISD